MVHKQELNANELKFTTTHTHPFNCPFSGTTRVSRYQKGTEARDSEWQWHQLGHLQVCTSLQTDNHASTPLLSFFTGQMPFLPPSQQRQSTEGIWNSQPWPWNYELIVGLHSHWTWSRVMSVTGSQASAKEHNWDTLLHMLYCDWHTSVSKLHIM